MWEYFVVNKKIIIALLIGGMLIGFAYFSSRDFSSRAVYKDTIQESPGSITLGELIGKDTDGDGISDWEEVLWGTDPTKKDTNGDGVGDKAEIEKRRPLSKYAGTATSTTNEKINETDALARQIFAAVSSLKQGGNLNADVVENLSKSLAENTVKENTRVHYALKDLRIVPTNKDTVVAYGKGLETLIVKYQKSGIGGELSIIAQALKDDSALGLNKLDGSILLYKNMARDMLAIPTPEDIAALYLSIINNYYNISVTLEKIKIVFENPIVGFSGLAQYSKETQLLIENTNNLGVYFTKNATPPHSL
ncbi:MAG: thrombospondin type 3 repeat-containing protein [Patescibacteria group bacterium]